MIHVIRYTSENMATDIDRIEWMLNELNFEPDCVVGLKRGGLIPAVCLSHRFGVDMQCVDWSTRDFVATHHNDVVFQLIQKGANVLIVDDINDSGTTLDQVQKYYDSERGDNVKYVTLISKTTSNFVVDYAANVTDNDQWVEFFWEDK